MTSSRSASSSSASISGAGAVGAQIAADAVPQHPRFADVQRLALPVRIQVDAGLLRQPGDLVLEIMDRPYGTLRILARREPSIIPRLCSRTSMTFTGLIGQICMFPLPAIINTCVALRIHPNVLTLIGVLINVAAAFELARGHFIRGGVIMVIANIFDFIDGKVAIELQRSQRLRRVLGLDVIDRFSDIALFTRADLPLLARSAGPTTSWSRRSP